MYSRSRQRPDRGIVLLIALGMLSLFSVLIVSYVVFSSQHNQIAISAAQQRELCLAQALRPGCFRRREGGVELLDERHRCLVVHGPERGERAARTSAKRQAREPQRCTIVAGCVEQKGLVVLTLTHSGRTTGP